MNIAVCDDNDTDAARLVSMLEGAHTYRIFSSAEDLLFHLDDSSESFDLYLLDIFMGEMNGVLLGKRIRKINESALICYISSSPDYYAEAFSLYAFQYLLKPVSQESFRELLRRASSQLSQNRQQCIHLHARGRNISIPYQNVLYITSMGHTLFIHCVDGHIERFGGRLGEFADRLDEAVFVRCHQSFLVNLYNVSALKSDFFVCGEEQIPISRRYRSVKERYRSLLFSEMT